MTFQGKNVLKRNTARLIAFMIEPRKNIGDIYQSSVFGGPFHLKLSAYALTCNQNIKKALHS
jgi:hypothetical protein